MAPRKPRKVPNGKASRPRRESSGNSDISASKESIKTAEDLAIAAFASGLRLAAAFGTVAAKTTSLALASFATGADKFSELIKQETLKAQKSDLRTGATSARRRNHRRMRRASRGTVLAA